MAGISFASLVDQFIQCLEQNGATVIPLDVSGRRPARIRVVTQVRTTECIVFLWTITRGGGRSPSRPLNERRIQMTGIDRIPLEPGVRTLLGGWSEEFGVHAFWDARRHLRFSGRSPSLQVTSETLEDASTIGMAAYLRPTMEGKEVVVAVNPRSLLWYVESGGPLHNAEEDALGIANLASASTDEERGFIDESASEIEAARRFDLVQTIRAYRDARFRPAVLQAYRFRCAICQCDLKLVDAAHILPVTDPRSTDEVTNGLALCRLHHGAYDNALVGVQSDYSVVVNDEVGERLRAINLARHLDTFTRQLPERIHVPASLEARPDPRLLKLGLEARRWPSQFVR